MNTKDKIREKKFELEQEQTNKIVEEEEIKKERQYKKIKLLVILVCVAALAYSIVTNFMPSKNEETTSDETVQETETVEEVTFPEVYTVDKDTYYAYAFGEGLLKEEYLGNYYAVDSEELKGGVRNKNETTLYYISDTNKGYKVINEGMYATPDFYLIFCITSNLEGNDEYDDEFSVIALQNKNDLSEKVYLYLEDAIKVKIQ